MSLLRLDDVTAVLALARQLREANLRDDTRHMFFLAKPFLNATLDRRAYFVFSRLAIMWMALPATFIDRLQSA